MSASFVCPNCGLVPAGVTHTCVPSNAGPLLPSVTTVTVTQTIDYEKDALRSQVQGLIAYVAERAMEGMP